MFLKHHGFVYLPITNGISLCIPFPLQQRAIVNYSLSFFFHLGTVLQVLYQVPIEKKTSFIHIINIFLCILF